MKTITLWFARTVASLVVFLIGYKRDGKLYSRMETVTVLYHFSSMCAPISEQTDVDIYGCLLCSAGLLLQDQKMRDALELYAFSLFKSEDAVKKEISEELVKILMEYPSDYKLVVNTEAKGENHESKSE